MTFDNTQAEREGWAVFEWSDGAQHIEKDDEQALWDSDDEAIAFVARRAAEGSEYHQQALAIHAFNRLTHPQL